MRSRIMVIARDAALRARLARLVTKGGHRAEVAESLAYARRAGLDGVALAIVDPDGLAADETLLAGELRDAIGKLLIVARPGQKRVSPDAVDVADEARLLARIATAVPPRTDSGAGERVIEFAGYRLDFAGHSLTDPAGKDIVLTPGEFGLLTAFAERAGRVLSRDQLLQFVAGREADAYDRSVDMQIMRLRRKIEPDPKRPSLIVTVPVAGYKFAAPVRETNRQEPVPRIASADATETHSSTATREEFAPPRLSIVVLPFTNIGGDPEQDYFADGVTESLTTDLSRISGAFVIACNTAFTYRGKGVDLRAIGRELNVGYALEGSFQRVTNHMRINVQLTDTRTGSYLWAERFDEPGADLSEMQDQIVARIANVLSAQLVAAEARRAERSPNPDSMDLYFQGRACLNRGYTPDNTAQARNFFDRALSVDPDNVDALASSGTADAIDGASGFVNNPLAAFAAGEAKLTKALSLAPDHPRAHLSLGVVYMFTKRVAQGIAECEHALELDRNLALAQGFIGLGKSLIGRAEETEAHTVDALHLSPRDSFAYLWMFFAGLAKLFLGADDQAVAWFHRSLESNRNYPTTHIFLAAALAQLGRLDEARSVVNAVLALNPKLNVSFARALGPTVTDEPAVLAGFDRFLEGLRKAGLPEK